MYEVVYYTDKNGYSELKEVITDLSLKVSTSKDARIQFFQITAAINKLEEFGARRPFVDTKHIEGKIWELRPGKNRILYFYQDNNKYVLLHMFRKKTQKTPTQEIDRAIREMNDYLTRSKEEKQNGRINLGESKRRFKASK